MVSSRKPNYQTKVKTRNFKAMDYLLLPQIEAIRYLTWNGLLSVE
jgi:hypothetical protein